MAYLAYMPGKYLTCCNMKTKKILEILLGLVIMTAMFLGCAGDENGDCIPALTCGCLLVSAVGGILYSKFFDEDGAGKNTD